ncbi:MAG: GHKL domain-containing protein [Flavobacteriales bacterium]|nr:GHKL domain-containing protein [Flavobacteriales bacterium]MCB9198711.1 GHKL domain-containing protein [Flavobacteriales bacterium]
MRPLRSHRKSILLFYILIGYIVAQIAWWIFQIILMSKQIDDSGGVANAKIRMLAGEFGVFFIILSFGVFYIHRVFNKELRLSQNKKNFSLSITHELKTPITTSKLFLESLLNHDSKLDPEKRKDIYKKIEQEQDRLNILLEKILMSSRMDNAEINMVFSVQDLSEEVKNVVDKLWPGRNIKLALSPKMLVKIDPFYFQSVIINLIDNAIKYSEEDSEIIVETLKSGGSAILSVTDQGIGISNEDKLKIFEMYHRLEDESLKTTKGTGLGLYLVERIVKKHQGKIEVLDNQLGRGTKFNIILPIA